MGKYGVDFSNFTTPTTTPDTALAIVAATGEESEIIELLMTGSGVAAAADRQHTAGVQFYDGTTAGTAGSSPTPELFDQRSNAADMTASIEFTAEPTNINAVKILAFGFNQRGGMRWAVPRGEGIKVRGDDTEDNLSFNVVSDAAGAVDGCCHFHEP